MRRVFLSFLLLSFPLLSLALPSDQQQPLDIEADFADLNQKTGVNIFSGKIKITQGTSLLTADDLTINTDKDNQLTLATAKGKQGRLAHYSTLLEADKPKLYAQAEVIQYYPHKNKIVLLGNAKVTQGADSFTAPKIEYDIKNKHVVSSGKQRGRTTITLHPKNDPKVKANANIKSNALS